MTFLLPECPSVPTEVGRRIRDDYERFGRDGLPADVEGYLLDAYGVDVAGEYAGRRIKNPFGKASGQLSLSVAQVRADAAAGLGFLVLKTVIAQDEQGRQSMREWAIKESHMLVEPIAGRGVAELGWTVTWKGRGWWDTFDAYLRFAAEAIAAGRQCGMTVAPSVKYHLPGSGEVEWNTGEYAYTTRSLLQVWAETGESGPMPLEKDFSPTLAGDARAQVRERVLEWMATCPRLIRAAVPEGSLRLGLKVMNTVFEDDFQMEVVRAAVQAGRPDYLVYANRLFDPNKSFEGKVGVAYGGPDLSARNLTMLARLRVEEAGGRLVAPVPPVCATGNVCAGRTAVEYALRGSTSLQLHTFFQLPEHFYGSGAAGHKTRRALRQLLLHPRLGLVPWLLHVGSTFGLAGSDGTVRFLDVARWHRRPEATRALERLVGPLG